MRIVPLVTALALLATPLEAQEAAVPRLTLERIFANPPMLGTPPRALTIAPDGKHIAFLRPRQEDQLRFDLWVQDVETGAERMAVDSLKLSSGPANLSEAELMRRERARLASTRGIVEYSWTPDGRSILVPLDGDIWLAPLSGEPRRITATEATEIDAKVSPRGSHASFVRDQNLYVVDLATGRERAMTTAGGGLISYGVAEFVAQEEMHRMTGQWWSPDDARIAIARVDETPVKVAVRAAIGSDGTRVSEQRYPFAGTPNAIVTLELHSLSGGAPVQVDLGAGLPAANSGRGEPDIYLARVNWLNAGQLLVQRQSRDQKRLDVLLVDAATGASKPVLTENAATWINLHDSLKPLADGKRFLWASERTGYRHLYLWDGKLRPITSGDWPVDEILSVDEEKGIILFTGFRETATEKGLYRVSLKGGKVERLTETGGWTDSVADKQGRALLLTRSTPSSPAQVILATTDGAPLTIRRQITSDDFPYAAHLATHVAPQFGTLKAADGKTDLNYALMLPPGVAPGAKVPVFVQVYGGPGAGRQVRRAFGSLVHQYLLQQGWAVFSVDNRGTPDRGKAFEDALYRRMGFPEVEDQVAALKWLKSQPFVDADRIAVYGWSYGGFMVQRMMTEHPTAFTAGVSGAPVTDWTLYDTHYTERYLGNPAKDMTPYTASDVTLRADRLARPMLLIHGLADDNVVFDHSARMMASLQKAGVPFETMLYPGQAHGIREPAIQLHLWRTITTFLDRTVKKAAPPAP
jgi:dipeptidyl-peptidase 4